MKESERSNSQFQDDRLADFADHALAGKAKPADPNASDELRALEETVLQLHRAFPEPALDAARIRQMQERLYTRISREKSLRQAVGSRPRVPIWQSPRVRQAGMVLLTGLAILIAAIILPSDPEGSSTITGTAGLNPPVIMAALVLLGALAIGIWLSRRK